MSNPNPGDPRRLAEERAARARLARRLRLHTVRTAPLPVLFTPVLVKQRVEVKTKYHERVGVVTGFMADMLLLAPPVAYDPRGFWTHTNAPREVFFKEQIERLTLLEGPAASPAEDFEQPRRTR